jgi:hypothetical protein
VIFLRATNSFTTTHFDTIFRRPEDIRLGRVLQEIGLAHKKSKKSPPIASPPISNEKVEAFIQETPPQNKSHYTYHEVVTTIFIDKTSQIYGHPIRKVYDGLKNKSLLICGRTALQNQCNNWTENDVLPIPGADGSRNGRPSLIEIENISSLNQSIFSKLGSTSSKSDIAVALKKSVEKQREDQGLPELLKTPYFDRVDSSDLEAYC